MSGSMSIAKRLVSMAALVVALSLASVGPVAASYTPPAEVQIGQIGHYNIRDLIDGPAVTCNSRQHSTSHYRISSIVVKIPYVWWPDTNSGTNHEHGTVAWKVKIQSATDPNGYWATVYTSSNQKATAYEDHPLYDPNDKAHFSGRTISWDSNQDVVYRVMLILTWYNGNGSTKGTITYWYQSYTGFGGSDGFCVNKYQAV